jgi:hypothetical protein
LDAQGIATIIGASTVFLTSAAGVWQTIVGNRRISKNTEITQKVETLVNSRTDRLEARVDQLVAALEAGDVPIPKKPNRSTP